MLPYLTQLIIEKPFDLRVFTVFQPSIPIDLERNEREKKFFNKNPTRNPSELLKDHERSKSIIMTENAIEIHKDLHYQFSFLIDKNLLINPFVFN